MKRILAVLIMTTSAQAWAGDPIAMPLVIQMQRAANASMCESYKGDKTPLGKAMNKQCSNRARAEFEEMQDEKPLRDCMKPGNVIDDDV